jgi:tetratricopeptide (TPR) repeat protein
VSATVTEKERQVIPRWREFRQALRHGELVGAGQAGESSAPEDEVIKRLRRDWERNRSTPFAGELVSAGVVLGNHKSALDAAEYLLRSEQPSDGIAQGIARYIVGRGLVDEGLGEAIPFELHSAQVRQRIRQLRGWLREDPRNGFWWVDLARSYAVLGQEKGADRAMERALSLTPDNRFVIRSASRLYLHLGEHERAWEVLKRSVAYTRDPWLLAAEIATASTLGVTAKSLRLGRLILKEEDYQARQTAELSSAIATLELKNGKSREAKRLFAHSLISPTENVIAQAEWALPHVTSLEIPVHLQQMVGAHEARFVDSKRKGRWADAMEEVQGWLWDQPFSSRPAMYGSYIASMCLEDFELSARLAEFGLTASPDDPVLLNNAAVALANLSQTDEAWKRYRKIDASLLSAQSTIVHLATEGLLWFKTGFPNRGGVLYQEAIQKSREMRETKLAILGSIYFARQLVEGGVRDGLVAAKEALELASKCEDKDVQAAASFLLRRIESQRVPRVS